jgi:hypothetical protein
MKIKNTLIILSRKNVHLNVNALIKAKSKMWNILSTYLEHQKNT